ncbi:MAG: DNRLRE domain-containing protein [Phycisphaerales bacterium]|nr:DNRLRE domain-containing protein [Phycisphaerales bacterium]
MSGSSSVSLAYALRAVVAAAAVGWITTASWADQVQLSAAKDNTLYQDNTGGLSNGVGENIFAGRTFSGSLRRAVIAFDLSSIPAGSTINSVELRLFMNKTRVAGAAVRVHRLLGDWGEGASDADGEEGAGGPAAPGDATWIHRFYDTQFWSGPGGDFAASPSATTTVTFLGSYNWSGPGMVADVQGWLDNPGSNFGWILIGPENVQSAKRFSSRESLVASDRPRLTVNFTPPPVGACCLAGGSCLALTQSACINQGGEFVGIGSQCDPNPCQPAACPGDLDCDGDVDFDDIDLFVAALGGQQVWADLYQQLFGAQPPCDYLGVADVDGSGGVNFDDIDPFVARIGSPCP